MKLRFGKFGNGSGGDERRSEFSSALGSVFAAVDGDKTRDRRTVFQLRSVLGRDRGAERSIPAKRVRLFAKVQKATGKIRGKTRFCKDVAGNAGEVGRVAKAT